MALTFLTLRRKASRALYKLRNRSKYRPSAPGKYSQHGQDAFVAAYFGHKHDGFFVDIGAHDGITFSNSALLEREYGWSGVAVEPNPAVFQRLEANRSCHLENCCIADREAVVEFTVLSGYTEMLSGITSEFNAFHKQRVDRDLGAQGGSISTIPMQCHGFPWLVQKYGLTKIDYASVDTEGSEHLVLNGIDFDKVRITLLSVENNYGDRTAERLLGTHGYRLLAILGQDEFYAIA